ncbi:hypothetical protein FA13DRAFT_1733500 [Coprinellus micaceus]|uniref:Uncharacterized protein n=1 Tax=Coprinellus micaceus TaxID=71717 RepID=A0A4Y7T8Z2_COPMI|nr:hypothetical protein FA13DRAFT_1733500 [Coprinellus micaceus]
MSTAPRTRPNRRKNAPVFLVSHPHCQVQYRELASKIRYTEQQGGGNVEETVEHAMIS